MFDIDSMPEFRSGNSVPVTRATISRERMQEAMDAYADARVREALEEAAAIADQKSRIGVLRSLEATYKADAAKEIAGAIRALIPQQ